MTAIPMNYVVEPDIPASLTIDEYRRSRPTARLPWWRRKLWATERVTGRRIARA